MDEKYDSISYKPAMYDGFASEYPVQLAGMEKNKTHTFELLNAQPYMVGGRLYMDMLSTELKPFAYTNWRDETLAWHLSCAINAGLNPTPIAIVKGPDAKRFIEDTFVNNVERFPIGTTKHGLMLLDDGTIAAQGVLLHTAEDEYEGNWLSPYMDFMFSQKDYDAEITSVSDRRIIFQTQGPRSLEMVEQAAHEDLHDLKYCHFRNATIAGHTVRILRFGMYGCLGYEIHCDVDDAHDVYEAVIKAGKPLGVRRIGVEAYMMDHTPGGSQQLGFHFLPATDPAFVASVKGDELIAYAREDEDVEDEKVSDAGLTVSWALTGSLGADVSKRLANPYMLGLDYVCDYSRDFRGKDALLEYKARPDRRNICTLEWNHEDLADIYESQYRDDEPYAPMDWPGKPWSAENGGMCIEMDKVLDKDGREIGYSAGRTTDAWYRAMVSLGVIEESYIHEGDEVTVLWGDPGTRQKKVRATITRFPFNQHLRNKGFDVEQIPHYKG